MEDWNCVDVQFNFSDEGPDVIGEHRRRVTLIRLHQTEAVPLFPIGDQG